MPLKGVIHFGLICIIASLYRILVACEPKDFVQLFHEIAA